MVLPSRGHCKRAYMPVMCDPDHFSLTWCHIESLLLFLYYYIIILYIWSVWSGVPTFRNYWTNIYKTFFWLFWGDLKALCFIGVLSVSRLEITAQNNRVSSSMTSWQPNLLTITAQNNRVSSSMISIIRGNIWDEVLGTFARGRKNEVFCIRVAVHCWKKNFGYLRASHDWRFSKFMSIPF